MNNILNPRFIFASICFVAPIEFNTIIGSFISRLVWLIPTRVFEFVVVLSPNWPNALYPVVYTLPILSATAVVLFVLLDSIPFEKSPSPYSPSTFVYNLFVAVVLFPAAPYGLYPAVHTEPSFLTIDAI